MGWILQRLVGYFLGFLLFYEPFICFQRLTSNFLFETGFASIHVPCARIPLTNLLTVGWREAGPNSLFFCLLLAVTSLWFGPLFCGRLCPAGGFSELLGSILPAKYKLDWSKLVPVLPLRYGFFAGFLASVWLGFATPCIYCNYYALEIFINYFLLGHILNNMLSLAATFILANILLGLFAIGGRGYCQMLCPVGTYCSLFHYLGKYLPGTFAMKVEKNLCIGCGKCVRSCPMRAISITEKKAVITHQLCITCGQCQHNCPMRAIKYGSNIAKEAQDE